MVICLQCGDVGFDAYIYCVKCVKFAVHRYCLPETTFTEYVRWICDDCEAVSSGSASQRVLVNTQDGRCTERVISTSTSGSNKRSISQSSKAEDENYGQTGPLLQSVHENLIASGDAQLADNCCTSGVEPNATKDWSREENVPTKDDHQKHTSQHLDRLEEDAAADESLQRTNLRKNTEVSSSSGKEMQILPTTSDQKRFEGELQSVTSRYHGDEVDEVLATKVSKRPKFRKNSDISSPVSENENPRQTTSAPSRFSPLRNERQSLDSDQIHLVEATEAMAEGSSQRTKSAVKRHISTSVTRKEKQMRRSTSPNQFQLRHSKRFGERSLRYPPSRNERKKDRSRSLVTNAKQRYSGSSSRETHKARRPLHDTVREREKERLKEEALVIPTRSNGHEEASQQTHDARRPLHSTIREKDRERVKEESFIIPTKSNVHKEVSWQPHELRKSTHETVCDRYKDGVKEESSVIPTRSKVNEEVSQQTHEPVRPMHNTVREKDKGQVKEESLVTPTQSNANKEVMQTPHEASKPKHNTVSESYKELVKKESSLTPTRSNDNEEVSRDPIITQPIPGPIGHPVQVQPVVDPIWRGRFDIVNKKDDTFEGFVAHLSSRACQQVIEEARLLPALLKLEMVPKSTVWPKSFQTVKPSDDNIALYIFPAERRFEKVFDRLVRDMSDQGLAMRTITKNAELLIFSSTELPMKYWRFQNKYFIWGVFRAKRRTPSNIPENQVKANLGQHVTHAARY